VVYYDIFWLSSTVNMYVLLEISRAQIFHTFPEPMVEENNGVNHLVKNYIKDHIPSRNYRSTVIYLWTTELWSL
jgi:hypothetical protein